MRQKDGSPLSMKKWGGGGALERDIISSGYDESGSKVWVELDLRLR